jgi:hypothetical protein
MGNYSGSPWYGWHNYSVTGEWADYEGYYGVYDSMHLYPEYLDEYGIYPAAKYYVRGIRKWSTGERVYAWGTPNSENIYIGAWWGASPSGNGLAAMMQCDNHEMRPTDFFPRSTGAFVRCVKDNLGL